MFDIQRIERVSSYRSGFSGGMNTCRRTRPHAVPDPADLLDRTWKPKPLINKPNCLEHRPERIVLQRSSLMKAVSCGIAAKPTVKSQRIVGLSGSVHVSNRKVQLQAFLLFAPVTRSGINCPATVPAMEFFGCSHGNAPDSRRCGGVSVEQ